MNDFTKKELEYLRDEAVLDEIKKAIDYLIELKEMLD